MGDGDYARGHVQGLKAGLDLVETWWSLGYSTRTGEGLLRAFRESIANSERVAARWGAQQEQEERKATAADRAIAWNAISSLYDQCRRLVPDFLLEGSMNPYFVAPGPGGGADPKLFEWSLVWRAHVENREYACGIVLSRGDRPPSDGCVFEVRVLLERAKSDLESLIYARRFGADDSC